MTARLWIAFGTGAALACTTDVAPPGSESESEAEAEAEAEAEGGGSTGDARRCGPGQCGAEADAGVDAELPADLGPDAPCPWRCDVTSGRGPGWHGCEIRWRSGGDSELVDVPCCAVPECACLEPPESECFFADECRYLCEAWQSPITEEWHCRSLSLDSSPVIDGGDDGGPLSEAARRGEVHPCCEVELCACAIDSGEADFTCGDGDADGVPDGWDNCDDVADESNRDSDGDGIGDACDPDADGDRIADDVDNCPLTANGAQDDADGDGIGDYCDD